jgi:hypothetical protein
MKKCSLYFLFFFISYNSISQELLNGKFEFFNTDCFIGNKNPFIEDRCNLSPWKVSHGTPQMSNVMNTRLMATMNSAATYGLGTSNSGEGIFYPFQFKKGNLYQLKLNIRAFSNFEDRKVENIYVQLTNGIVPRYSNADGTNYNMPSPINSQILVHERDFRLIDKEINIIFWADRDYEQIWFTLVDTRQDNFTSYSTLQIGQVEINCIGLKFNLATGFEIYLAPCSQLVQDICQVMPGNIRYIESLQNSPGVYVPNVVNKGTLWEPQSIGYNRIYNAYKYKYIISNRWGATLAQGEYESGIWGLPRITWNTDNVSEGLYYVSIELTNCSGTYTYKGTILVLSSLYRNGGNMESETLKIYPNPAQNILNIELGQTWQHIEEIKIMDMYGVERFSLKQNALVPKLQNNILSVDVAEYPRGRYIVNIITKDNLIQRHLMLN